MSRRKPGRLRVKLAKMLCEALPDVDVRPEDIQEAQGWYRTSGHRSNESYRWEAFARVKSNPSLPVVFGSFSTMGSCVRYGVSVTRGPRGKWDIDVDSNEPALAAAPDAKTKA